MRFIVQLSIVVIGCSRSAPTSSDAQATAATAPTPATAPPPADEVVTSTSASVDAGEATTLLDAAAAPAPSETTPASALEPVVERPLPISSHELVDAALSPDGTRLAVAYPEHVALFDAATGAASWLVSMEGPTKVVFSPSGQTLWVLTIGNLVRLSSATGESDWSAEGGPIEQQFVPTSDEGGLAFGAPSGVLTVPLGARSFMLEEAVTEAGFDAAAATYARYDAATSRVVVGSTTAQLVLDATGKQVSFASRPDTLGEDGVGESILGPTVDTRVAVQDGEALLIDAKTWRRNAVVKLPTDEDGGIIGAWSVGAVHARGPRAVVLGPNETVVVDFGARKVVSKIPRTIIGDVWPTFLSADGSELWTLDGEPARWRLDERATPLVVSDMDPDVVTDGERACVLGAHGTTALRLDGAPAWSAAAPHDVTWHAAGLGGGRLARVVRSATADNLPVTGVQLLDAATGALQSTLALATPIDVGDDAVAIDGERVVLVTNDRIVVWPLPEGAPIESKIEGGQARAASTAAALVWRDGKLFALTIGADGKAGAARAIELALAADAPMIVVGTTGLVASEGKLHTIDLVAGAVRKSVPLDSADPAELAADAALGLVVVRTRSDEVRVHDGATGARRHVLSAGEPTYDIAITPDGKRVVSAGKRLRIHALDAPPKVALDGYLAPVLRARTGLAHRWSATATVIDTDTGKETVTPSKGEGTCAIEAAGDAFALTCKGLDIKSDYEVKLPASFERKGDVVETDAGWRLPIVPRPTTHIELGRGSEDAVEVVRSRRFYREGDTWCYELREGVVHPGFERLCFYAQGGLASYTTSMGSAAMSLEARVELAGPDGFPEAPAPAAPE